MVRIPILLRGDFADHCGSEYRIDHCPLYLYNLPEKGLQKFISQLLSLNDTAVSFQRLMLYIYTMTGNKNLLQRNKATIIYSISLAFLLFLLKWLELRFIIFDHSFEIYIGFIAVIFTALGIWLALKLSKPKIKTVVVEKEVYVNSNENFVLNTSLVSQLELSKRELEILGLMAQGLSNQEIAGKIFVSLSTVKTHIQNLFEKLDVKRRTQAVEKGKRLNLIP